MLKEMNFFLVFFGGGGEKENTASIVDTNSKKYSKLILKQEKTESFIGSNSQLKHPNREGY